MKVFVCIGPRPAGKSTLLGQMAADLLAQGTARENLVFINFQDDRLKQLRAGSFDLIPSAYYGLIATRDEEGMVGKEGRNIHIILIARFLTVW
ncbi:MAG: AAA family ATPase [Rectinemataceae bacterium]